jgi:hypothetical protein
MDFHSGAEQTCQPQIHTSHPARTSARLILHYYELEMKGSFAQEFMGRHASSQRRLLSKGSWSLAAG